ncbi:hypothetical protein [Microtetraspora fusca]|nr:hypothetical protein [Microtetraspora fusca]
MGRRLALGFGRQPPAARQSASGTPEAVAAFAVARDVTAEDIEVLAEI